MSGATTPRTGVFLAALVFLATVGCPTDEDLSFCERILTVSEAPADHDALDTLLGEVRQEIYPDSLDLHIALGPAPIDGAFFQANLDLTTADWDPRERHYQIQYTDWLFDDPPGHAACGAVLIHEHKHVEDYAGMDTAELAEFTIGYLAGGEEVYAYERETDMKVLEVGCGEALIELREWAYDHLDEDDYQRYLEQYYTPDEIREWMGENGEGNHAQR